jgi:hypothetical protein
MFVSPLKKELTHSGLRRKFIKFNFKGYVVYKAISADSSLQIFSFNILKKILSEMSV